MSLPSGYKRLEYIRFSGTQYLPSITIPQDFKIEVTLAAGTTGSYMNIYDNTAKPMLWIDGSKVLEMDTVKSGYTLGTEKVTIVSDSTGGSSVLSVNGTVVQTATKVTGTSFTVTLFNRAGSQCFVGDLCALKASSKTATIVDYVPCIDASGNVGVYDLVGEQFYGNAGTGTFTAGPVIAIAADESEIKELEYIHSSGTQYINAVFKPNQKTRVSMKMKSSQSTGSNVWLFGCQKSWASNGYAVSTYTAEFGKNSTTTSFTIYDGIVHEVDFDCGTLKIDGSTVWSASGVFQTELYLYLAAINANGTAFGFDGYIYSCQTYDNGTFVRDYIAAKLADGTVGLYDKLNGLLYINAGTGTFTAGPEVQKVPSTPTGFAASALTDTTVQLNWTTSDGATGYNLYKNGALLTTLTDTSYTDTIQPFTSYIYTLTAYNDKGESDPATISVQIIIPPETPSNFRASSVSMTVIILAWDAVTGAESYQLSRDGVVIYTGEYPSYTDRGLTVETAYTYTLSAVNTAGSSAETTLEATTTKLILVTDRTAADVAAQNAKGTYNASDLNRVGEAMNYVADRLRATGYDPHINPKTDWKDDEWVTPVDEAVYLGDLAELRKQFTVMKSTPKVPPRILATGINTNDGLTHTWANDIERILEDVDALLTNISAAWFFSGDLFSGEV